VFEWNDFTDTLVSCSGAYVAFAQLMFVLLLLFFCILGITELVALLVQHHDESGFFSGRS